MPAVDGIILGAGHNGLILQAYASQAGLSTICLESGEQLGGGLATVESPAGSGFLHNTHSFFHRGVTRMPWFTDLQLERYGAHYLEPELNVALITSQGEALEWWTDFAKTFDAFRRFSRADAERLQAWREEFVPIVRDLLIPAAQAPPLPRNEQLRNWERTEQGRRLIQVSRWSPLEFVRREFEHPVVQAGLLFFNGLREVDLRLPGFGHHIPALLASDGMAQICRGGSQRLAEALAGNIRDAGGQFVTGVQPSKLHVKDGRVRAVESTTGDVFEARRFVASSLNPQQTFLDLLDASQTPVEWQTKARDFEYNILAPLFSLNLNLRERPRYRAGHAYPHLQDALMVILGLESVERFEQIVDHHEQGSIPPTVMWGACPSNFDSSQAPAGQHTAFMWEKLPYRIAGDAGRWDRLGAKHGHQMLELWTEYAPNLSSAVIDSFVRTPLDVERTLPNMRNGDLLVGSFANDQVGYHRPFPGAGHYRSPLEGLYLCGSCCHPGGNITGLPGYNCAQVLLADLGVSSTHLPS